MKVLFSNPPWHGNGWHGVRAGSRWPYITKSPLQKNIVSYCPAPLFLMFATSYLRARTNHEIMFRDSIALKETYEEFWGFLESTRPDFLVFETATPSWEHDAVVIRGILEIHPECKIIVTGPIAASRAEEILEKHPVHAVVKGEYERGVYRAVNGESGIIDFDILSEADMNAAPWPYMDHDHFWRYWDSNPKGSIHPQLQAWSTRGCVYRCIWCSWPANMTNNDPTGSGKRAFRYYSPDYMEGWLLAMKARHGFKSIYLDGDTENAGDKHTLAMCEVMRRVGLPWTAMCRIDTVKRETWKAMKDAGCVGVKVGLESGSSRIVNDVIHKNLDLEKARDTIAFLKSIGLTVHGTFSFGAPSETEAEMRQTLEYIRSLPLDTYQTSGVAVVDGTPMDTLEKGGSVPKYPGAKVDANYISDTDGNRKMEAIADKLGLSKS